MDSLEESKKYAALNPPRRKPRVYSYALNDAIIARIPPSIIEAMNRVGWNPLGVFEVVEEEIRKERKAKPRKK